MVAAYAAPAGLVWMLLGLFFGLGAAALPISSTGLSRVALVAVAVYGCCYGVPEVMGRAWIRPPGRSWQVPQTMVIGASPRRRIVVWGAILGPGFLTRNPHAGFGLLPLILVVAASSGVPAGLAAGAGIGVAHGAARALALLRDVRAASGGRAGRAARVGRIARSGSAVAAGPVAATGLVAAGRAGSDALPGGPGGPGADPMELLLKTVRWRTVDGCLLLLAAGGAIALLVY